MDHLVRVVICTSSKFPEKVKQDPVWITYVLHKMERSTKAQETNSFLFLSTNIPVRRNLADDFSVSNFLYYF